MINAIYVYMLHALHNVTLCERLNCNSLLRVDIPTTSMMISHPPVQVEILSIQPS